MSTRPSLLLLAVVVAAVAGQVVTAQDARLQAVVGGTMLPAARVASIVVDAGASDVDAATVTLAPGRANLPLIGEALEVIGGARIFKGEIVGIEPVFDAGGESRVIVRGLNKLHRLTRGKKSRAFENTTDADIVARIAADHGLVAGPALPETSEPESVFQHNQTDLEFLRERAARIGLEVVVDDDVLMLRRPDEADPVPLGCSGTPALNRFHPRLSSTVQVAAVTVRGWDPLQKKEIVGKASRATIALSPGAESIRDRGPVIDLGMVQGIESTAAAYGAAIGTLRAMTVTDLSAEAEAEGHPSLRAGVTVSISGVGARFDGKYYVTGVSHRYHGSGTGWRTLIRVTRTDRGHYALPEVGDEVLVAFANGDISRPVIVGTLWNADDGGSHGRGKRGDGTETACLPRDH